MRFALGLLVGLAVGAGGMYLYLRRPAPPPAAPDAAPPPPAKKRRPAATRPPTAGAPDLRPVTVGDVLRPDQTIDMQGGGETRDLGQTEIDAALAGHQQAVQACLLSARDAAGAGGRVTAAMLVGPDGRVRKTRVDAPRALVDAGLAGCLREEMARIRFPAAGGNSVVTVPLEVD
ncbi:MAG TPA: AgmX/PglI C-terminal domain-containing protein [Haliangiales bacterium]|nr:AgmX/PglI C-terminal domain-containing protein [Haliangiales bacterium]